MIRAMIWDGDGTLSDTDETRRAALNETFRAFAIDWNWDRATYGRLLRIATVRDRLRSHAEERQMVLPDNLLRRMQADTAHRYMTLVRLGGAPLRLGVAEVIAAARAAGIRQAIVSTTPRPAVAALVQGCFAAPVETIFDALAVPEDADHPDARPNLYRRVLAQLGLRSDEAVAITDSAPGLAAARAAGLRVMVTPSTYTAGQDFAAANWVAPDLGGPLPGALACLNAALGRA